MAVTFDKSELYDQKYRGRIMNIVGRMIEMKLTFLAHIVVAETEEKISAFTSMNFSSSIPPELQILGAYLIGEKKGVDPAETTLRVSLELWAEILPFKYEPFDHRKETESITSELNCICKQMADDDIRFAILVTRASDGIETSYANYHNLGETEAQLCWAIAISIACENPTQLMENLEAIF